MIINRNVFVIYTFFVQLDFTNVYVHMNQTNNHDNKAM